MKYFDWSPDTLESSRKNISEPSYRDGMRIDAWRFKSCEHFNLDGDELWVDAEGVGDSSSVIFGAFELPFFLPSLASSISAVVGDQVQWVAVRVRSTGEKLYILNALREIKCIDESRSVFEKWEHGNSGRPDKVGQYKWMADLAIDDSMVGNSDVFRPWGWRMPLIVSQRVKLIAEAAGVASASFTAVA